MIAGVHADGTWTPPRRYHAICAWRSTATAIVSASAGVCATATTPCSPSRTALESPSAAGRPLREVVAPGPCGRRATHLADPVVGQLLGLRRDRHPQEAPGGGRRAVGVDDRVDVGAVTVDRQVQRELQRRDARTGRSVGDAHRHQLARAHPLIGGARGRDHQVLAVAHAHVARAAADQALLHQPPGGADQLVAFAPGHGRNLRPRSFGHHQRPWNRAGRFSLNAAIASA